MYENKYRTKICDFTVSYWEESAVQAASTTNNSCKHWWAQCKEKYNKSNVCLFVEEEDLSKFVPQIK